MINNVQTTPTPHAVSSSQSSSTSSSTSNSAGLNSLADEQTFMQLLVAQLENQDPTQPQDGMQFITQLAQFASLEQGNCRPQRKSRQSASVGANRRPGTGEIAAGRSG